MTYYAAALVPPDCEVLETPASGEAGVEVVDPCKKLVWLHSRKAGASNKAGDL